MIEPPVSEQTLSRWWPPPGAQVPGKDAPQQLTQNHPQLPHRALQKSAQLVTPGRKQFVHELIPFVCSSTPTLVRLAGVTLSHSLTHYLFTHTHTEDAAHNPTCQWSPGLMESRSCFHSFSCHSIGCRNIKKSCCFLRREIIVWYKNVFTVCRRVALFMRMEGGNLQEISFT